MEPKTVMYDADGNETDDRSRAVRGELVERDDEGNVLSRELAWEVDAKTVLGDQGNAATRPHEEDGG